MDMNSGIPDMANLTMDEPRIRRSSRNQRALQPESDVFGDVCSVPVSSGAARRRSGTTRSKSVPAPGTSYPPDGFALKALTNNNTSRNQHYFAQLEINIVRKPGNRPESPSMKLRTILEKQKEEQGQMRAERAKRRRPNVIDSDDDEACAMEVDDSIISVEAPPRHLRGPGDDEDYQTPDRPTNAAGKRVKWDHGLGTSIFLDEIIPQGGLRHRNADRHAHRRGCLVVDPEAGGTLFLGDLLMLMYYVDTQT